MQKMATIYLVTVNNDPEKRYVGQTVNFPRRKRDHLAARTDSHLHNTIRKYGTDKTQIEVLARVPADKALEAEADYISQLDTYNKGLNRNPGGEGGSWKDPEAQVAHLQKELDTDTATIDKQATHYFGDIAPKHELYEPLFVERDTDLEATLTEVSEHLYAEWMQQRIELMNRVTPHLPGANPARLKEIAQVYRDARDCGKDILKLLEYLMNRKENDNG